MPSGTFGEIWMANAACGTGAISSRPVPDHLARAVMALFARLEHEFSRCRSGVRGGGAADAPRPPAWPCAHRVHRHAWKPSTCDLNGRSVSSGIGSASMSPRSRMVGPCCAPRSVAIRPEVEGPSENSRSSPSRASLALRVVSGQMQSLLGMLMNRPAQTPTTIGISASAPSRHFVEIARHGVHVPPLSRIAIAAANRPNCNAAHRKSHGKNAVFRFPLWLSCRHVAGSRKVVG